MSSEEISNNILDQLVIEIPERGIKHAKESWSKKVWRVLRLDTAANKPLLLITDTAKELYSISDVLFRLVLEDGINAVVSPWHVDVFTREQVVRYKHIVDTTTIFIFDKLLIAEQWFYDKQNKRMVVKIVAIAMACQMPGGTLKPLFWVNHADLRKYGDYYFLKKKIITRGGKRQKMSLKGYLEGRFFYSRIIKTE